MKQRIIFFFLLSLVGTGIDFLVYSGLVYLAVFPTAAHVVSYPSGMICNFLLQRRFIFSQQRTLRSTVSLALGFWMVGYGLTLGILHLLVEQTFFNLHPFFAKLCVMGFSFFYNFFTRRFAFEGGTR